MQINRLLTDTDRKNYRTLIDDMFRVSPEMMKRKISRANIQQAFVLGEVLRLISNPTKCYKILSVGHYDDTAYDYLMNSPLNKRIDMIGIDPQINMDLHSFRNEKVIEDGHGFDIIFSTSVIEHVENDMQFMEDICLLLNSGGHGILTMDFNDNYKLGDKLPATDLRFYTKQDLEVGFTYLVRKLGCDLVDTPDWNGEPEFTHDGCNYSFATFVFRKNADV